MTYLAKLNGFKVIFPELKILVKYAD